MESLQAEGSVSSVKNEKASISYCSLISLTTFSIFFSLWSKIHGTAPSSANFLQILAPIPLAPPVTIITKIAVEF